MYYFKLDYAIEKISEDVPSREQILLKEYSKKEFSKKDAAHLWKKITDHKWYVGERLRRDVGFHVATIDFLENFYEPNMFFGNDRRPSKGFRRVFDAFGSSLKKYFVPKSKIIQI